MSFEKSKKHRGIWQKKEILRKIYLDWYKLMIKYVKPGKVVELGSGSGNLTEYYPDIISSDITLCPWLDMVFDATAIPFEKESIDTIIMIDLLHHLEDIISFFTEVDRILKNKGRLIMLEPYISPFSFLVYNYFHQESINLNVDIFTKNFKDEQNQKKNPFDANQAVPTLIFFKKSEELKRRYPNLQVIKKSLLSFILYPLSGGFEHRCLIPMRGVGIVNFIERLMSPLAKLLALRTLIVIEKVIQ